MQMLREREITHHVESLLLLLQPGRRVCVYVETVVLRWVKIHEVDKSCVTMIR